MIKGFIRITLIVLGLIIALMLLAAGAFFLVNHTNGRLVSSGVKRAYLLYVPESYDPSSPTSLVISLHGFAEWPAHQMEISRWNDLADQYGFIVVYPSGTNFPLRWRAYSSASGSAGSDSGMQQDVTFISDLIDRLETDYNIDPSRIYANGLSNGGGMSFLLSCKLSERIAAIGSVSGAYLFPLDKCNPTRPVPIILFHGTADPIVPFQGGPSRSFNIPFPSIDEWVAALAVKNGCSTARMDLPTRGNVSGVQYTDCDADVQLYTITRGGHSWPGGVPMPKWIVGNTSQDVDATKLMWDFFQQHQLTLE